MAEKPSASGLGHCHCILDSDCADKPYDCQRNNQVPDFRPYFYPYDDADWDESGVYYLRLSSGGLCDK